MTRAAELTGQRFGKLVVCERTSVNGRTLWNCRCDCGNTTQATTTVLNAGEKKSCGCLRVKHGQCKTSNPSKEYSTWISIKQRCHNPKCFAYREYGAKGIVVSEEWRTSFEAFFKDMGVAPSPDHTIDREKPLLGYRSGNCRWVLMWEQGTNRSNSRLIVHGEERITVAEAARRFGFTYNALHRRLVRFGWDLDAAIAEPAREYVLKQKRAFPGSEYKTAEYRAWISMRFRCNNPRALAYANYGGAGIKVCERWDSYANFLADMGRRPSKYHSLDRKKSHLNYTPANCRWGTRPEQASNRSSDRLIEYQGEHLSIKGWSRRLNISYGALKMRFRNGWDVERALSTPLVQADAYGAVYTFQGNTLTLRKWGERLKVPVCTLQDRLNRGWSVERTFTTIVIRRSPRIRINLLKKIAA